MRHLAALRLQHFARSARRTLESDKSEERLRIVTATRGQWQESNKTELSAYQTQHTVCSMCVCVCLC